MTKQLELPLWKTMHSIQMKSEQVDFQGLLADVEEAISQVSESELLQLAGEVFLWMAEVYATRFETWIEEREQASRDPMVERGCFDALVRQTIANVHREHSRRSLRS